MSETIWGGVDDYLATLLAPGDDAIRAALAASDEAGLPQIAVSPLQGKLLDVLVRTTGGRRVLEIGTLGGYSTIWMARALAPGGAIVTLEAAAKHAEVARANLERAGVSERVDLREGKAIDTLPKLAEEGGDPFDFVFIDADKESIPEYFDWAVRLARVGGMILVDNVVRKGGVVNADSDDPRIHGCRRLNEHLAKDARVSASVVQTVGAKGHDGFVLAVVLGH